MSIDGTGFRILQTGEAKTGNWFAFHKYSFKSALRYEIGVSIIGGGQPGTRQSKGASRRGGYSSKRTATTSDGTARFFRRLQ